MACEIIFTVREGDTNKEISLSTNLTEQDFESPDIMDTVAEIIIDSITTLKDLANSIKKASKGNNFNKFDENTIPNYTVLKLKKEFPTMDFGTGNYLILFVDANTVAGKPFYNIIQKENGKKLFIINETGIRRFSNYTLLVDAIMESINATEDEEKVKFLFEYLPNIYNSVKDTKTLKVPKTPDLFLISFIENTDFYAKKLNPVDYAKIKNFLQVLLNRLDRFKLGKNELVSTIETNIYGSDEKFLSIKTFLDILSKSKLVNKEDKKLIKDRKDDISTTEVRKLLQKYFINDSSYQIKKINPRIIVLKNKFQSFIDRYGFSFETVLKALPVEVYKGYNIYEFNSDSGKLFVATRDIISTHSPNFTTFDDIESAKLYVDLNEPLLKAEEFDAIDSSILGIQQVKLPKFYAPDAVIKKFDYHRNGPKRISEKAVYTMQQFRDLVNELYNEDIALSLLELIDNPQYLQQFYYYATFTEGMTEELLKEDLKIAVDINSKGEDPNNWKYYSVLSSTKRHPKESDYYVTLISIKESDLYRTSKHYSSKPRAVDVQFAAILKIFSDLGVKVEIINELPENVRKDAKAFLSNGVIYINAKLANYLDAMHEYTHLFLQLLKVNDNENYNNIISLFALFIKEDILNEYKERYAKENLSEQELIEEIFADKYSEFLRNGTKLKSFLSVFSKTSNAIADIQNIDAFEFINSGNDNMFTFMEKFASYMKETINDVGFGLPSINVDREAAENYIQSDKFPTASSTENNENDMFKICE